LIGASPRTLAKRAVERALVRGGVAALSRLLHRRRTLILAYHNIVPHGERAVGDASLHLTQDAFADQLDLLGSLCEVVSLAAALDAPGEGPPRVAITFDDAYAGALEAGAAELARRRLPATMFVAPGLLGGQTYWWDATHAHTDPAWRRDAMREAAGHPDRVRSLWQDAGNRWETMPEHARSGSTAAVRAFRDTSGMTLGAHGWLHLNLPAASAEERRTELRRSLEWLGAADGADRPVFAYPYGSSDATVAREVAAQGYRFGLLATGGWLPPASRQEPLRQPRLNVPAGMSLDGFGLRVSGVVHG
jgi:peptidoglycan/xylan/chitin deacetylase (PgdA/CDA1 family)